MKNHKIQGATMVGVCEPSQKGCKTKLKLKGHRLVNFLKILSASSSSRQVQSCQVPFLGIRLV